MLSLFGAHAGIAIRNTQLVKSLRESERRYRELADALPDAVFEVNQRGMLTFVNRQGLQMFGYAPADLARGLHVLRLLSPEDRRQVWEKVSAIAAESNLSVEHTGRRKDGSTFPVLVHSLSVVADGQLTGFLGIAVDITERKEMEVQIQASLREKETLLREIHHRVKNNLQTISSLLRLQARRLTNPEAKAAVQESVRRNRTIALVHESLSREPGEDIAFIEIVRPLLRLAEEGLQSPDRPVRFTVSGDGGRIPAHTATPLSVVLTELLQNAVDHGFPEGSGGGEVQVMLAQHDGRLTIRVVDNGRGVDPSFDIDDVKGLGLSIVRTLVTTELNGTIDIRPATGDDLAGAGLGDGSSGGRGTVIELCVPTDD